MDNQATQADGPGVAPDSQAEARIDLQKHYLQGRLLAVVAEAVGQISAVNQAQISELVDSCEPGLRYREELSSRSFPSALSYSGSLSASCESARSFGAAVSEDR